MTLAFEKCCHSEIENGATAKYEVSFFPFIEFPELKQSPIEIHSLGLCFRFKLSLNRLAAFASLFLIQLSSNFDDSLATELLNPVSFPEKKICYGDANN